MDVDVASQVGPGDGRCRPGPPQRHRRAAAIRGAIATWDRVLRRGFEGLITLSDVTGAKRKAADILVRSDLPPSLDREPYTPEYLGWVTLHELATPSGSGMPPTCWRAPT